MTEIQAKEQVGDDLLKAMKSIDEALMMMHQLPSDYSAHVGKLRDAKASIKKILNADFDDLAIKRKHNLVDA